MNRQRSTNWRQNLSGEVRIGYRYTEDERSREIKRFCDELAMLAPLVKIDKKASDEAFAYIQVRDNVRYLGVPQDKELAPFLEALGDGPEKAAGGPGSEMADRITVPASLKIYVSPHCPHCPTMARKLIGLARNCSRVFVSIIDGTFFPQMPEDAGIRSAPTTTLDDHVRWTGQVDLAELVEVIATRDFSRLGRDSLMRLLQEGEAERLARLMKENGQISPEFIDLLTHEKWSIRLGAMVVYEYLEESDAALADRMLEMAWEHFESADDPVKGDILFLVGKSGAEKFRKRINAVANGPYSDSVREAAGEALLG